MNAWAPAERLLEASTESTKHTHTHTQNKVYGDRYAGWIVEARTKVWQRGTQSVRLCRKNAAWWVWMFKPFMKSRESERGERERESSDRFQKYSSSPLLSLFFFVLLFSMHTASRLLLHNQRTKKKILMSLGEVFMRHISTSLDTALSLSALINNNSFNLWSSYTLAFFVHLIH